MTRPGYYDPHTLPLGGAVVLRGTNDTPTAIVGYVNLEYKYKRTTRPL